MTITKNVKLLGNFNIYQYQTMDKQLRRIATVPESFDDKFFHEQLQSLHCLEDCEFGFNKENKINV